MTACPLHYLGCDRSDAHLDFTLLGADLAAPESVRLRARAADVQAWLAQWRRRFPEHQLCICFEQPAPNLIVLFSRFDFVRLYPINPATLKSYREAFVVSRAKDDKTDGYWLADLVRTHRDQLPSWAPLSPEVARAAGAVAAELRQLLEEAGTQSTLAARAAGAYSGAGSSAARGAAGV